MNQDNRKDAIKEWVNAVLNSSPNLSDKDISTLKPIGIQMAEAGFWRGDISAAWINMGYRNKINDLYP